MMGQTHNQTDIEWPIERLRIVWMVKKASANDNSTKFQNRVSSIQSLWRNVTNWTLNKTSSLSSVCVNVANDKSDAGKTNDIFLSPSFHFPGQSIRVGHSFRISYYLFVSLFTPYAARTTYIRDSEFQAPRTTHTRASLRTERNTFSRFSFA